MAVTISGTTGIAGVDGSAGTPAVQGGDSNTGVFFPAADTVAIATGGSERLRADSSGNVGIGTTSPNIGGANADNAILTLKGKASTRTGIFEMGNFGTTGNDQTLGWNRYFDGSTENASIEVARASSTSTAYMKFSTNGGSGNTERARITSGGYFKASFDGSYGGSTGTYHEFTGTTANGYTMRVRCTNATPLSHYISDFVFTAASPNNTSAFFIECRDSTAARMEFRSNGGIANYSGNNVNLSDRREKTNFAPAGSYLPKICAIPVQTFNYIDQNMEEDPGETLGVVAQDVQSVAPELVMESNWGTAEEPKMRLSIYQTDLQYALMKCIQEQQALIESLTTRIAALEAA